MIQW
jgi:quercetin dioxygenase-like cupin family protein